MLSIISFNLWLFDPLEQSACLELNALQRALWCLLSFMFGKCRLSALMTSKTTAHCPAVLHVVATHSLKTC